MWAIWLYFTVSTVSLGVQATALLRIMAEPITPARGGLRRTAICRVIASSAYVSLGIAALFHIRATSTAAFGVLLAVQLMWQLNGVLDARLARRLNR